MLALLAAVALIAGGTGAIVSLSSEKENVLQAGSFHEQSVLTTHAEQPTTPSSRK